MRIQILSDLHCEINGDMPLTPAPGAGLVIAAGDIHNGIANACRSLRGALGSAVPIVLVAGNHDYYGRVIEDEREGAPLAARDAAITWLDDGCAQFPPVRIIGATLWTDYEFYGADLSEAAMAAAARGMNDHALIRTRAGGLFSPQDARTLHRVSREFLAETLALPFAGPTVVVTHHLPHERSVARRYAGSPYNPAFASDLDALIREHRPALWVHGHTHASLDYRIGSTRVVCNPLGYGGENPAFDPALVVEV